MNKKTSLKELAEYLGLSQTTVSRGLADYPEVTERTKTRIREAAKALNYAPSSTAQKLVHGKSLTIGHVIRLSDHRTFNPFYADFIAGAGETYSQAGYDMLISMVAPEKEMQTYRDLANSQKVDGFILSEPVPDDPRIALLHDLAIPFALHGRSHTASKAEHNYNWLDVNNKGGFEIATAYLLDQGHRDIAFVNGLEIFDFALRRKDAFLQTMQKHKAPIRSDWLYSGDMSEHAGFEVAQILLSYKEIPTAILCSSVLQAMGIQRALNLHNKILGKDVSVICWDDCLSGFHKSAGLPQFTSMQSSIYEAGAKIAHLLLEKIQTPDGAVSTHLLEAQLVIGQSTGKGPFYQA